MSDVGEPITGQRVVDGDASTATALTLYPAGGTTARTLADDEWLEITHLVIACEDGGDCVLITKTAGQTIFDASLAATSVVDMNFCPPRVGEKGEVPLFSGPNGNKTSIFIQGYIRKG